MRPPRQRGPQQVCCPSAPQRRCDLSRGAEPWLRLVEHVQAVLLFNQKSSPARGQEHAGVNVGGDDGLRGRRTAQPAECGLGTRSSSRVHDPRSQILKGAGLSAEPAEITRKQQVTCHRDERRHNEEGARPGANVALLQRAADHRKPPWSAATARRGPGSAGWARARRTVARTARGKNERGEPSCGCAPHGSKRHADDAADDDRVGPCETSRALERHMDYFSTSALKTHRTFAPTTDPN